MMTWQVTETYGHNNAVAYPHENRAAGREHVEHPPHRQALYSALSKQGALFGFSNAGVELPIAFLPTGQCGATPVDAAAQKTFTNHVWAAAAEAEAAHLLESVGIGYSSFSKLRVASTTPGCGAASRLLEYCTTNTLPKQPGRCRLSYATTAAGKLLAEFTITRKDDPSLHEFYLVGSRDYARHDLAWLEQQANALVADGQLSPGSVALENLTDAIEILHVAGAGAAGLMSELCPDASAIPFLQMRELGT